MSHGVSIFAEKGAHRFHSHFASHKSLPRPKIVLVMILLKTTFSLLFGHCKYLNLNTKSYREHNLFCVLIFGNSNATEIFPKCLFLGKTTTNLCLLEESCAPALTSKHLINVPHEAEQFQLSHFPNFTKCTLNAKQPLELPLCELEPMLGT